MENALMTSLEEDSHTLLEDIIDNIPKKSKILGVCVKLYQSYDCCPDCRLNILKHISNLQKKFDLEIRNVKKFKVSTEVISFMVHGLMIRSYGQYGSKTCIDNQCKDISNYYDGSTNIFDQKLFCTFSGKIDGNASQTMMPVYIHMQPSTKIDSDCTVNLASVS